MQRGSWEPGFPNQYHYQNGQEWHEVYRFCLSTGSSFRSQLCSGAGRSPDHHDQGQAAGRADLHGSHKLCPSRLSRWLLGPSPHPYHLRRPGQWLPLGLLDQPPPHPPTPSQSPSLSSALKQGVSCPNHTFGFHLITSVPRSHPLFVGPSLSGRSPTPSTLVDHAIPLCHCLVRLPHHGDHRLPRNTPLLPLPWDWVGAAGRLSVWESPSLHLKLQATDFHI